MKRQMILGVVFALASIGGVSAKAAAATLSLSPTSGPTGTSVTASGRDFPARVTTTIQIGSSVVVPTFKTGGRGRFSKSFTVPAGYSGPTPVTASTTTGTSVSASFDVTTPPPPDRDGDGVPDSSDQCPDQPGPPPSGCPTPPPPGFDFLANDFSGQSYDQMPPSAQDLAVAPDGVAVTGATWIESAHDVRAYTTDGTPVGPWPGNSSGRFRENGGGPLAVDATNQYLYAAQAQNVVRWDRSTFMSAGSTDTDDGTTVHVGSGQLTGIAACAGNVYVSDPGSGWSNSDTTPTTSQIREVSMTSGVIASWTAPHARTLTCDREGNVWVLEQGAGPDAPALARYSPTGLLLTRFTVPGYPMDVAADPTADRVWVADNSQAQKVEAFDYSGRQVATLGQSYLSGPTPGLVGPGRFAGLRGVGVDAQGNVYVAENGAPDLGSAGWPGLGKVLVLSKYSPTGQQVYRREGLDKASTGEPSDDGSRFYDDALSYKRGPDGRWDYYAFTAAGPNDPRFQNDGGFGDTTSSQVRDFGGERYVYQQPATSGAVDLYRVDGEILTPVVHIDRNSMTVSGTTTARPDSLDGRCAPRDYFAQANGDVWLLCQDFGGVWRFRMTGVDANGVPQYAWNAVDAYPMPSQISGGNAGRIDVEGGAVYVSGNAPNEPSTDPDSWLWMGHRIVKFASLPTSSGWPAPTWNRAVFWNESSRDRPVSFDVDGNTIAVGYQACNYSWGSGACLRFYSATTGDQVGSTMFAPPEYGRVGWLDEFRPISFKGGQVYVEDDDLSKLWVAAAP